MTLNPKSRVGARLSGVIPRASILITLAILILVQAASVTAQNQKRVLDLMVPMRDGTQLATTVYLPEGDGPWPVVLSRTPYNKNGLRSQAPGFNEHGYVFVAQDCRGRFESDGEYVPFRTDAEDGYDTVEWAAAADWSDGKIGMTGGSALGITANLAASAAPPHLVACYVVVAPSSWRGQTLWIGGLWRKEMIDGWMAAQGSTEVRIDWQKKAVLDPYFDWIEMPLHYAKVRTPTLNLGGWFDIFLQGTLDNFTGLQAHSLPPARGNQKVVIAPMGHGALRSRFQYPENAGDLGVADPFRWFDYWLKGVENGIMDEPPVRYYLMGDAEDENAPGNVWRTADSWPPPSEITAYYLGAGGGLSTERPGGENGGAKGGASGDFPEWVTRFIYDPDDPAKTVGGANLVIPGKGPMDQREVGDREDYFRFHSDVLTEPVEVVGPIEVELYVETDAPDTDFMAKLVDVYPDGYEALILDSGLRLRYREGLDREVMMKPGEVVKIKIDLWATANVFNKGHRIGVHVTSSNNPRFDPNPNTGHPLRADDEKRLARNGLHHDAAHPSRILLPIMRSDSGGK